MFCYASLVVFYTSALPIRLGVAARPDPISNIVELFTYQRHRCSSGAIHPFATEKLPSPSCLASSVWLENQLLGTRQPPVSQLPPDALSHINSLREFSEMLDMAAEERNDYNIAFSRLESVVRQINLAGPSVETGTCMVYIWPFGLPKSVTTDIQERQPLALIVLAHYCGILNLLDNSWFLHGWGRQLLSELGKQLPSAYAHWLE
ncbi:uncharacterized protein DSM5745_03643 [Aspergillus mulundensis]|uniref:C6 transcription factor n=1 Tax=Aspergillus mulundensis TaxID=1810919 RepID=A0A3D8SLE4_9EURO|nr:hypothetical protein DSM5745_03643 [Aspergillus mulundensis]RDW87001.1 hypothetical protein DSM5745_03643 [Aspergillus mulundensis]